MNYRSRSKETFSIFPGHPKYNMKQAMCLFSLFLLCINSLSAQIRTIQWKDFPNQEEHIFPLAYINGNSDIEKNINGQLQGRYLNNEESYRDSFYEYEGMTPTANICGVSITYEHEFNTAPGIWSYTDRQYFDIRSGAKVTIDKLFHDHGEEAFLKIANQRKNDFVNQFSTTLNKEQEDYQELLHIIEYTIKDSIKISDLGSGYELTLQADRLILSYNWEWGWGIGRHELPNIVISYPYQEIKGMLNDYGKSLLLYPKVVPHNKLFYGYIGGKYRISALIRETNDSTKITYWYDSNKKPLNWIGSVENDVFILEEYDANSKVRANITLSFYEEKDKIRAIGKWKDLSKQHTLTIELFEH